MLIITLQLPLECSGRFVKLSDSSRDEWLLKALCPTAHREESATVSCRACLNFSLWRLLKFPFFEITFFWSKQSCYCDKHITWPLTPRLAVLFEQYDSLTYCNCSDGLCERSWSLTVLSHALKSDVRRHLFKSKKSISCLSELMWLLTLAES